MRDPESKVRNDADQPIYQVLSLDVVLGALSVGAFAVKILGVTPHSAWWFVLPLAVWSVYTFDHLVDGYKKKGRSNIYRHLFHYKNRKILVPLVIITGAVALVLSLLMLDRTIVVYGIGLSLFVLFYFFLVMFQERLRINYIQKELFIMAVYITGILLAPFAWRNNQLTTDEYLVFFILAGLAWSESVMISYYDQDQDKTDHLKSFTVVYGHKNTRISLTILLGFMIFLSVTGIIYFSFSISSVGLVIELIMAVLLLILVRYSSVFHKSNLFRWIGEAIFLLPAFILFF